jgi:hypothetical protein
VAKIIYEASHLLILACPNGTISSSKVILLVCMPPLIWEASFSAFYMPGESIFVFGSLNV